MTDKPSEIAKEIIDIQGYTDGWIERGCNAEKLHALCQAYISLEQEMKEAIKVIEQIASMPIMGNSIIDSTDKVLVGGRAREFLAKINGGGG